MSDDAYSFQWRSHWPARRTRDGSSMLQIPKNSSRMVLAICADFEAPMRSRAKVGSSTEASRGWPSSPSSPYWLYPARASLPLLVPTRKIRFQVSGTGDIDDVLGRAKVDFDQSLREPVR
jgi:hypothetical protein